MPAFNVDYEDAIKSSLGLLAAVVIGATLLVLSISFRSALIPLKAVALNLLSVAAAFGAVTLVFQDGYGAHWIGLPHALDGGFPILPALVFCIVFGLSMDYEVFIVARIADERRAGRADENALIEGMAGTGRVGDIRRGHHDHSYSAASCSANSCSSRCWALHWVSPCSWMPA